MSDNSHIRHELNNVINGILGAAEIIEENSHNKEKTDKFIKLIIQSALKATELTKDIK